MYNTLFHPITLHRDRYPSPNCAYAWVCSWYLLLVYTMYFSNPTAVFMYRKYFVLPWFAHKEHNHGFPDFPVQQHSYFLFSTRYFYFLVVVKHSTLFIRYIPGILYRAYWNITILRTPGTYIRGIYVQKYTWYPGIIRRIYDIYYQVPGIYLVYVRQTYTW